MEAPKCRTCGKQHWPRFGCDGLERQAEIGRRYTGTEMVSAVRRVTKGVTAPVTKPVTSPSVTERVTKVMATYKADRISALQDEVWRLEGEVKRLKRALAEAHGGGKPPPLSNAERVRKFRAKRKPK